MWHRFLDRVSLIDSLSIVGDGAARQVRLETPALEGLEIRWFEVRPDGTENEVAELQGCKQWPADSQVHGRYRAEVVFRTDEVRTPTDRFQVSQTLEI